MIKERSWARLQGKLSDTTTQLVIAGFSASLVFVAGCTPQDPSGPQVPTANAIFEPDSNHNFGSDSGRVDVLGLEGRSLCYTLDGSAPSLVNDSCIAGAALTSPGQLDLACEGASGSSEIRTVRLAFSWEGSVQQARANYILDCTPAPIDSDLDGVSDDIDNCPSIPNSDQLDSDGDSIGDACEDEPIADADSDTRQDDFDNCPSVWNRDQADDDGDGIGNVCDTTPQGDAVQTWANDNLVKAFVRWKDQVQCDIRCTDPTGGGDMGSITCANGGVANWEVKVNVFGGKADSYFTYTNCEYTTVEGDTLRVDGQLIQYSDFNGNGNEQGTVTISGGDYVGQVSSHTVFHSRTRDGGYFEASCSQDPIADEDCAPDNLLTEHYYPDWECSGVICPLAREPLADTDGDGVFDVYDNCPAVANADQANIDFDAAGDACDDVSNTADSDGDGIPDSADNCPIYANPSQDDADNDGVGDACDGSFDPDSDADGIVDEHDNCPAVANADQLDTDEDESGDVCDATPLGPDSDNDGIADRIDNCPDVVNNSQADTDGDGIGNACDSEPGFAMIFFNQGSLPGRCLKDNGGSLDIFGSEVKTGTGCDSSNSKNQWEIIDVAGSSNVKLFKSLYTNECLEAFDVLGWKNLRTRACNVGNSTQKWRIERYDNNFDFRFPSRLHNIRWNTCIYTDGTGNAFGTLGNCNLLGTEGNRQVGIYFGGDFNGSEPYEPY
jgi:hypothetical protein